MPNSQNPPLFQLIKTLSKSEKRNFRLFVNRGSGSEAVLFVQLFDVLDKQKQYDEAMIFRRIPAMKRQQLSNLKRHLYKQLLTSLRQIETPKDISLQVREQIDFAKILYNKGLYLQSLKVLEKVKVLAQEAHQDLLELEVIEFEKRIEAQHITRRIENRADSLAKESTRRTQVIEGTARWSRTIPSAIATPRSGSTFFTTSPICCFAIPTFTCAASIICSPLFSIPAPTNASPIPCAPSGASQPTTAATSIKIPKPLLSSSTTPA